ncbi:centrosomal protein 15 isoform X1 [Heterodontus francisci]|uniref:centrosomal protein 15 isoform X1 n=1 Tax=Heterodontus francisci TaxID=7792 RepID=UPI00355AEB37
MKMSYLAHEVELSKRHEEILSLRTALLQQMEDQLECQMNEKKLQAVEFELANERNTSLLKDLEIAEEKLRARAHMHLHPTVISLETRYWTSVEGQLPKWEQFLLGKTNSPVGVTNSRHKKSQKKEPQDKVTIKSSNLPPSAFAFKTPPQSPHSEKQKGTKAYF